MEVFLSFTFLLKHFKLPTYYCISIKSVKKYVDGEIIFVNICDHHKILKMSLQYLFFNVNKSSKSMSEVSWSPHHIACFDLAQNLRSGIAVHSKRSESIVTAQHEIHERSSFKAAARAKQH